MEADEPATTADAHDGGTIGAVASDQPLTDPADDRLGYAPFAQTVAKGIDAMSAPEGLVVGIYGAWGLGKTTVLNFVEHYLKESDGEEFVVIRFAPWWFSGRSDLAEAFFAELRAVFAKWHVRGDEVRKQLARYTKAVGAVPGLGVAAAIGELLDAGEPADVSVLKQQLSSALRNQDVRLLIMIDDIDRLTQQEVGELFAVIKALADFPNTIYLLAFDRDRVASALSDRAGGSGLEYLEKIVQVSFELPLPDRDALQTILLAHLQEIVGEVEDDLLDRSDWTKVINAGIRPLITTPRHVVRLTNTLRITYPAVAGEVNVTDFIALETLRLFEPGVYDKIRSRPDMFGILVGLEALFADVQPEAKKAFHREWLDQVTPEHKDAVRELVSHLFPRAAGLLEGQRTTFGRTGDIQRTRRISDPQFHPLYFRLGLGDQVVSRAHVTEMLRLAGDPDAFGRALVDLTCEVLPSGRTRAGVMLDELVAQTEKGIAQEHVAGVFSALMDVGDALWIGGDNETHSLGTDNATRITTILGDLLRMTPDTERCALIERSIQDSNSVTIPVLVVRRLAAGLGVPNQSSASDVEAAADDQANGVVTLAEVVKLEAVAVERIQAAANSLRLASAPRVLLVLGEWARWGSEADVRAWMEGTRADDELLAELLLGCRSLAISNRGERIRLNPMWFGNHVDINDLADDVRRLLSGSTDEEVKGACQEYLKELELVVAGKDPDNLHDHEWT